ncbi:MAG: alpha-1,2-fucosyltransferase [Fibrobacteria bacterium]|nr:alpha-1,2-fucosyltransferase [Fibrobacteria bacterium]
MIIMRLKGGLGNQLFQYALGRKLSLLTGYQLKFDIYTSFENCFYNRSYKLHHFNIHGDIATVKDMRKYRRYTSRNLAWRIQRKLLSFLPFYEPYIITQNDIGYSPFILKQYKDAYFNGYWQTQKYFIDIEDKIKEELQVKHSLQGPNLNMANKIKSSHAVCVHIRRLHGVSVTGNAREHDVKLFGTTSIDYYDKAVAYIYKKFPDIKIFVFSDDPLWVIENVKFPCPSVYVSHNDLDHEFEDLRLMSFCKHHIIANSTFSWWAAWLNRFPGKIVIAPKQWGNSPELDNQDLLPETWLRF